MTPTTLLFIALSTPPTYYYAPTWEPSLEPIVSYWADKHLVPRWLAWKTMMYESSGNPRATGNEWVYKNGRWVRGKVLAEGLFMIAKDKEHRAHHVKAAGMTKFDPWNPSDSSRVGMAFMGYLLRYFGDVRPALAAYNAGRNRSAAWWWKGRALPRETVRYVKDILG